MEEISTDVLKNRDETDKGTRSVTPEQLENSECIRKNEKEKPDPCGFEQGQEEVSVSEFDENIDKENFIHFDSASENKEKQTEQKFVVGETVEQQLFITENDAKEAGTELVNCDKAEKVITEQFIVSREDTKLGNEDFLDPNISEEVEKTQLHISQDDEKVAANETLEDKIKNEQISGTEKIENLEKFECSKVSSSKIEADRNEEVNYQLPRKYTDEPVSSEAVENREKDIENLNLINASQLEPTEQQNFGPKDNLDQLETCNAFTENLENEELGKLISDNFQMVGDNNAEDIIDKQDDYELLTDDSPRGLRSFDGASDYDIVEKMGDDVQKNSEILEKTSEQVLDNCDITEESDIEPLCNDEIGPDKHLHDVNLEANENEELPDSENLEEKAAEKPDIVDCTNTERMEETPAVGESAKGAENMKCLKSESVSDQEEEIGLNSNDDIKKEIFEILESPECNNDSRDIVTENMTIEEEKNNESIDDTIAVGCVVELNHPMNPTFVESIKEFPEQLNSDREAEGDFEKFELDEPVSTQDMEAPTILENNFSTQKSDVSFEEHQNDDNSQIVENDEITLTLEENLLGESKLDDHTSRI